MTLLAPDILDLTKGLSPAVSIVAICLGLVLWSIGGRTHRFWLALTVTLAGGIVGLSLGRDLGVQPLVAGLLLALAAGTLALALARIGLFLVGGMSGLLFMRLAGMNGNEFICFVLGGLLGVGLYLVWISALMSLVGTLLMAYGTASLLDRLGRLDSVAWAGRNGPLVNWGLLTWALIGMLIHWLLERRRRGGLPAKSKKKVEPKREPPKPAPPPLPPPAPPEPWWKVWKRGQAA